MRLPVSAHTERRWRIHEITTDFTVEDVWSFRTPGAGPEDFPLMLDAMVAAGGPDAGPPLVRALFAIRWWLGRRLGWDAPAGEAALDADRRTETLRDRLPADLRGLPLGASGRLPLTPVYQTSTESAREIVNRTVHAVAHFGWVAEESGDHELRMAVLVKPNGRFGRWYMAFIAPFRHLIVYPALERQWERAWRDRVLGEPDNRRAGAPVDRAVGHDRVPESLRRLSPLPQQHYVDAFTLATDVAAGAEQWARAMFGDAPDPAARLIFHHLLRMRLAPPSPDTIAGLRVAQRGGDWIRLEGGSSLLDCHLVVRTTADTVTLATVMRYRGRLGAAVWTVLSAVHRRLAAGLLRTAAATIAADQAAERRRAAGQR